MPVLYIIFLHYEGWSGPEAAWANKINVFLMKLAPEQYQTRDLLLLSPARYR